MCGIAAVFHSRCPGATVVASLDRIRHRGSSTFELETLGDLALGANRLPIVGRSGGKQPAMNETFRVFAVLNGEIFNHRDLRAMLQARGHVFATETDTEVLVHAYEEFGEDMVNHLDSEMFAFVIHDTGSGDIFAARDRLGVKPLYYAVAPDGELHFASELKQLCQFERLDEIREFPAGFRFRNGVFTRYATALMPRGSLSEQAAVIRLEHEIVQAVRKRVDTDLPIGVFLSGGVDSSLIMEIAVRLHPDVTAIVLGDPESSDYQHAIRLCQERGYKHHVVQPHVDYAAELDEVLYHVETYEPLVIRQTFANWICSREAQRLGLNIVLVGEGADELFAGYNEFSALSPGLVNEGCRTLVENLDQSHLKRVDRAAMRFTVEVRSPFLDPAVVDTAFEIGGQHKLRRNQHRLTTKHILRTVAARFLPSYIAWRYKMPFANGAGMDVGYNFLSGDGELPRVVKGRVAEIDDATASFYGVSTDEEKYYLARYLSFGYGKLAGGERRAVVKDTLHTLERSEKHRLVVAEFDKLALYFPVYLAAHTGLFAMHGLDVDFIATGGDDSTYASLCNSSAQIGLSDPLFAMFEGDANKAEKGEIVGQLVGSAPVVAVAIDPRIRIDTLDDLARHRIGTFTRFTTTHTIAATLLGGDAVRQFPHADVLRALEAREIDVAVVLAEQAIEIEARGGRIVFDFSKLLRQYFFSGFTVSGKLEARHRQHVPSFIAAVREALAWIRHHRGQAVAVFQQLFPDVADAVNIVRAYEKFWHTSLAVDNDDYLKSHALWRNAYPAMLKSHAPYLRTRSAADPILRVINGRKFRREYPFLEDRLRTRLERGERIDLVGFWGAGSKSDVDRHDRATIEHFDAFIRAFDATHAPGVTATFLLADRHAENNGYEAAKYERYLLDIAAALNGRGFRTLRLSELWDAWGVSRNEIRDNLERRPPGWWDSVSIAKDLENKAGNNFQGESRILGAQSYFVMREIEKPLLETEFASSVFFVFGDSVAQQIYPCLPTLYLWSEGPSCSPCPWFTSDNAVSSRSPAVLSAD